MKTIRKSVLLWYSPEEMFELVTQVAAYPEFLPWCDHASVLASDAQGMTAEVGIAFGGIRQTFVTRNTHVPGREVVTKLVKGPFSRLDGTWRFQPISAPQDGSNSSSERACRVEFDLSYGFSSAALSALVGPVFDKIAGSLVDAFVKRAEQVYG